MNSTAVGAIIGAILALTWITLNFGAFVLVALAMVLGAAIARYVTGELDIRAILDAFRGRGSSR